MGRMQPHGIFAVYLMFPVHEEESIRLNEIFPKVCVLCLVYPCKALNKENRPLLFSLSRNLKLITVQIHVATIFQDVPKNVIKPKGTLCVIGSSLLFKKDNKKEGQQAVLTVGGDRPRADVSVGHG